MTYEGKVANHPYKPEHEVEDGIFRSCVWDSDCTVWNGDFDGDYQKIQRAKTEK